MNVFMPYIDPNKSAQALDDKRLIKQILECYQIINANRRVLSGEEKVGYANHPVVKYYRNKEWFLLWYGFCTCSEYNYRTGKEHRYFQWFAKEWREPRFKEIVPLYYCQKYNSGLYEVEETFVLPIYEDVESEVYQRFREKLINKWNNDKRPPKWTDRLPPLWYKENDNDRYGIL